MGYFCKELASLKNSNTMSTSSTRCDGDMCAKSLWNSECDNSYQKSKFRRKRILSAFPASNTTNPIYDSSRLRLETVSLPKSSECYHQTRLPYAENAQISTSTARPTCVFDCNHEVYNSTSIPDNQNFSSNTEFDSFESTRKLSEPSLSRKRYLEVDKRINFKSHLRRYSSVRQWYRALFFLIQFIILNQLIELTRVESFGHRGGLASGGLVMKGGLFASSDKSKMSVFSTKLRSPKRSSNKNGDYKQQQKDQMQADSPYNVDNLQEIFRNLE